MRFSLQRHKTPEFGEAEFWVENARLCSELLWLPLRPGFAKKNSVSLCKGTKAQEFCKAEFLDSMPVSALGTGVLISEFGESRIRGLWLTAFGK